VTDGYKVRLAPSAIRDLDAIPPKYTAAILAFLDGPLAENPHRVGKALQRELTGYHSARRGDYRVLYAIHDEAHDVLVTRIDHRAKVYRS
jgi:mRNA interferase RelE/StbE